jgi:DNA primase
MNAVANLGTTISPKKLYNLKKYTDNIIVMFDNDFGGKSGESMLKEKAKNFNFNIQVLNLPVDPDDFLLFNGKEQLLCKIQQTKSYFGSLKSSITLNLK